MKYVEKMYDILCKLCLIRMYKCFGFNDIFKGNFVSFIYLVNFGFDFQFMEFEISKLRQLLSILGDLFCFDGDVIVFQGDICVILVVYGFGEVKVIKELLDKVIIDVVYKLKLGLLGCVEKLLERII